MDAGPLRAHRIANLAHAALLLGGLGGLLMAIGYVLAGTAGMLWAGAFGVAGLVFTPRISPGLVLRMYRARPVAPIEAPALYALLERLTALAGLPRPPALYHLPSPIMNAFSVGRPSEAAVAVTDGLLRGLPARELTGVLAHEISHIRHNDMWIMSLADAVSRIVRSLSFIGQILVLINLPMLLMQSTPMPWLPLLLLVFAPTLSALLQLALSRNREFDADLEAVRLTGDPEGLARALTLLERQQEGLWRRLIWPGGRGREPSLLRTHPNSEARIARLAQIARESEQTRPATRLPSLPERLVPDHWATAHPYPRRRAWF